MRKRREWLTAQDSRRRCACLTKLRERREWLTAKHRVNFLNACAKEIVQIGRHRAAENVAMTLPISLAKGGFLCKREKQLSKSDREGSPATPTGRVDTTVGSSSRYYAQKPPTGGLVASPLIRRKSRWPPGSQGSANGTRKMTCHTHKSGLSARDPEGIAQC